MARILVTGADGFIGRVLCDALRRNGATVIAWTRRQGDVADGNAFSGLADITHVFHLAARTFVPDSWKDPSGFHRTNVTGTLNVLELCRRCEARLTFVSAYLYGVPESLPISEKQVPRPNNPYALSKWMAEELCRFYSSNFGTGVTVLRPFNVYGLGQGQHFLIPEIVRQVRGGNAVRVKDLAPRRDYVHIDDLVDALLKTLSGRSPFDILNIGSGESMSVAEIISVIQKIAGTSLQAVQEGEQRINEIPDVRADISRARSVLGWEPRVPFTEGIHRMLQEEVMS